jgi:pyruvate formate lyase activating enzyme
MPRERQVIMGKPFAPEDVVAGAMAAECKSIAYTYTEPTIYFEYALDTARLARRIDVANVFVTNGFMTAAALEMIEPHLDGANVDLKAFREETYRRYVKARLQPVLDSLIRMKLADIWIEVTTLVIPGINDDPNELRDIARFISNELGPDTPWHISRFFPHYRMIDVPQTPVKTLIETAKIGASEGLRYIYIGNAPGLSFGHTICPGCERIVIERSGYGIVRNAVRNGSCPDCGTEIAGVEMDG